ncbi:Uncharacterized protein Fot_30785 [Forsythia ovata]|uniref:Uncharacterized protein n=1 Tax=Forsythia ovata TaxID=205694 RepID=A0ABD1T3L7_9LAMI
MEKKERHWAAKSDENRLYCHVKHAQDVFNRVKGDSNVQPLSIPYPYLPKYRMIEHVQSWPSSKFPISSSQYNPYLENGYIPQRISQHQAVFNRNQFQIFDTNCERLQGFKLVKKSSKVAPRGIGELVRLEVI